MIQCCSALWCVIPVVPCCHTITVQYLSGLVGAHEKGMSHEAFGQTPTAANTGGAVGRLPAGVADHCAAPQVVLVLCAARAVSSLQGAAHNRVSYLTLLLDWGDAAVTAS